MCIYNDLTFFFCVTLKMEIFLLHANQKSFTWIWFENWNNNFELLKLLRIAYTGKISKWIMAKKRNVNEIICRWWECIKWNNGANWQCILHTYMHKRFDLFVVRLSIATVNWFRCDVNNGVFAILASVQQCLHIRHSFHFMQFLFKSRLYHVNRTRWSMANKISSTKL